MAGNLTFLIVHDNRALSRASDFARKEGIPLIALFVLSPQDYIAHDRGARRIDFTLRNLAVLKVRLPVESVSPLNWVSYLANILQTSYPSSCYSLQSQKASSIVRPKILQNIRGTCLVCKYRVRSRRVAA